MDIFDELEREREGKRNPPFRWRRRRFPWARVAWIGGGAMLAGAIFAAGAWLRPVLPLDEGSPKSVSIVVPMATIDDILGRKGFTPEVPHSSVDSDLAVRNALASRRAVGLLEHAREAAATVLAELEAEHARRLERLNKAQSKKRRRATELAEIESEAEEAIAMSESAVRNARETQAKLERSAYRALMAVSAAFNTGDDSSAAAQALKREAELAKTRLDEIKRYSTNPQALIADLRNRAKAAAKKAGRARSNLAEVQRAETRAVAEANETAEAINRASQSYMATTRRIADARRTAELAAWDALALSGDARRAAAIDAYEKLIFGLRL